MSEIENWLWQDFDEVDSTNTTAYAASKNFDGKPKVFTALSQKQGRGRMGRKWVSLKGNLFFSQLFYLDMPISYLVFISSVSIAESIKELAPKLEVSIKWPNDVLVKGGKISGILIETGESNTVIVGIGVNLISAPKADNILYKVADLRSMGCDISREQFLQTYLRHFNTNIAICKNDEFLPLRQKWMRYAAGIDKEILINQGAKQQKGIFKGIDEQGYLLLKQGDKITNIAAGDVFLKD